MTKLPIYGFVYFNKVIILYKDLLVDWKVKNFYGYILYFAHIFECFHKLIYYLVARVIFYGITDTGFHVAL